MAGVFVVADDLTGAADSAVGFAAAGATTFVFLPWTRLEEAFGRYQAAAYSIDTASRTAGSRIAFERMHDALAACRAQDPEVLYLKLDSALRGPVGPALSALRECFPGRPIPVAFAFPENGRTTVNGRQLVDGTPVDAHEMGRDALTPVKTAHIPTLLADFGESLVATLDDVRSDRLAGRLAEAERAGVPFVVIDAETRDDLDRIAAALRSWRSPVVCAGSGGLSGSLARSAFGAGPDGKSGRDAGSEIATKGGTVSAPRLGATGPALTVSTSRKSITAKQIDALLAACPETTRIELHPDRLAGPDQARGEIGAVVEAVRRSLAAGCDAVVHAASDGAVDPDAGPRLLGAIGEIAARAHASAEIALTMVVGGDTAAAVLKHAGADGIELLREVVPGVPLGRIAGGPYSGRLFVTKSGGFGAPDTLVRVREFAKDVNS